jgi:hypothetical protein
MQKIIIEYPILSQELIMLEQALDLTNPHVIIAKEKKREIVGIIHRVLDESRDHRDSWRIQWNSGGTSNNFPSVKMLIIACSKQDIDFYLIKM